MCVSPMTKLIGFIPREKSSLISVPVTSCITYGRSTNEAFESASSTTLIVSWPGVSREVASGCWFTRLPVLCGSDLVAGPPVVGYGSVRVFAFGDWGMAHPIDEMLKFARHGVRLLWYVLSKLYWKSSSNVSTSCGDKEE